MESHRELIKSEFKYYLAHIARSARRTSEGFNLGKTAVDSFLAFIEPQKLFDYDADKWKHIVSMYDITDCDEVKSIADELLNDEKFIENDNKKNRGWRSGSLMHYVCFINARSFFSCEDKKEKSFPLSNMALQQIYYGAPGTGKSHIINEQVSHESVIRTTFHPDSDYSTFVGCYKPTTKVVKMRNMAGHVIKENGVEVTEDRIVYEFVEQAFLQAYIKAWKFYDKKNVETEKQFLVIEEINRGNCAQIFGDLFQLLDRNMWGFSDYPIQADNDMRKQLVKAFDGLEISEENRDRINACYKSGKDYVQQVLDGKILLLPDNLYIWATMNTSDQSLFPIDSAFKRRWDWQYMPICEGKSKDGQPLGWKIKTNGKEYDWWMFIQKINAEIGELTKSEDKKLGYFFCKPVDGIISAETFVGKVIFYLWNDVFKDQDLGSIFHDNEGNELSFNSFYGVDMYGKVIVQEDVVEMFLDNLELKSIVEKVSDETNE